MWFDLNKDSNMWFVLNNHFLAFGRSFIVAVGLRLRSMGGLDAGGAARCVDMEPARQRAHAHRTHGTVAAHSAGMDRRESS